MENKHSKGNYSNIEWKSRSSRLTKFNAKSGWYNNKEGSKVGWRMDLPNCWKGSRPVQARVRGMSYSSILQVPSTDGSKLLKVIGKLEPRLAKTSGYLVKLVEKSGKPLSNMFSKDIGSVRCHRDDCLPCQNDKVKGPSLCAVKSVVYESVCEICESDHLAHPNVPHKGKYVG